MFRASHLSIILAPLVLALPQPALAAEEPADPRGEAELAKILEGRAAGEAVRCLSDHERRSMQIVDHTAFVFRDGRTIYVNRPKGARFLDDFDVPVFKIFGSDLCRMDQVEMRDRGSPIPGPQVLLGDFIPYRLADGAEAGRDNNGG